MQHWRALKELFVCMVAVVMIGMTLGMLVVHEQYTMRGKAYVFKASTLDLYEIKKEPIDAPDQKTNVVDVRDAIVVHKQNSSHVKKLIPIASR